MLCIPSRPPRIPIVNWSGLEGGTAKGIVEERSVKLGKYIIENKMTERAVAKKSASASSSGIYGCNLIGHLRWLWNKTKGAAAPVTSRWTLKP